MHPRLRTITFIHFAIASGLAMALVVFYFVGMQAPLEERTPGGEGMDAELFLPIAFLMAMGGAAASFFLPNIIAAQSAPKTDGLPDYQPLDGTTITDFISAYQRVKIIQWALLDGPGLFCGVVFFLTGRIEALAVAGLMLLLLAFFRASRADFQKRFGLSDQQLKEF